MAKDDGADLNLPAHLMDAPLVDGTMRLDSKAQQKAGATAATPFKRIDLEGTMALQGKALADALPFEPPPRRPKPTFERPEWPEPKPGKPPKEMGANADTIARARLLSALVAGRAAQKAVARAKLRPHEPLSVVDVDRLTDIMQHLYAMVALEPEPSKRIAALHEQLFPKKPAD